LYENDASLDHSIFTNDIIKILHKKKLVVKLTVIDALSSNMLSDISDEECKLTVRVINSNALLGEDDGSDHCELDPDSTDEQLNPVEKLEKFLDCEHSYSRYSDSHRFN